MKNILLLLVLFTFVSCSEEKGKVNATYYISNSGSDQNDGLSSAKPWKTIKNFQPGNTYLLKRGDVFNFPISSITDNTDKIIVADYGKGVLPIISLYKKIKPTGWLKEAGNIWKVDLTNATNYTGYKNFDNANVGFINVDGRLWGNKFKKVSMLKKEWDFTNDNKYLYVYLSKTPAAAAQSIQVATKKFIIELSNNMELRNLSLMGTGAHALTGKNLNNVTISNVDITDVGGSYQFENKRNNVTRYGNGIQFWNAANCLVENCNVRNVYDAAYTLQSYDEDAAFENIVFRNNKADKNEFSFEFWLKGRAAFFKRCQFINNYCSNAGMGWSHDVRPDKAVGVHLICYFPNGDLTGLTIANNTFVKAKTAYMLLPDNLSSANMFVSDNNKIELDGTTPLSINQNSKFILNTMQQFKNFYGLEKASSVKYQTRSGQ